MSKKTSHVPQQTFSWKLQGYCSMCNLLVVIKIEAEDTRVNSWRRSLSYRNSVRELRHEIVKLRVKCGLSRNYTAQKISFPLRISLVNLTKSAADLGTFTEEILNGKLHFLCSVKGPVEACFCSTLRGKSLQYQY